MELIYSSETFGRPVPDGAGRAGRPGRGAAQGLHGGDEGPGTARRGQRIGLAIDPISGEDLQELAAKIFATPKDFVEKVKDALVYRAP